MKLERTDMKKILATIVIVASVMGVASALIAHSKQAEARPGRVTALEVALTVA
jgi:hypothetical protein